MPWLTPLAISSSNDCGRSCAGNISFTPYPSRSLKVKSSCRRPPKQVRNQNELNHSQCDWHTGLMRCWCYHIQASQSLNSAVVFRIAALNVPKHSIQRLLDGSNSIPWINPISESAFEPSLQPDDPPSCQLFEHPRCVHPLFCCGDLISINSLISRLTIDHSTDSLQFDQGMVKMLSSPVIIRP